LEEAMPEVETYAPGTFSWVELATHDGKDAKRFYTGLFGWATQDNPIGPDQYYTMLLLRGKDVGALYQMGSQEQSAGVPPHWNSYVSVASVDDGVARARELDGKIIKPGFDVMDAGRMAVIQDPTGASFCLWQAGHSHGAALVTEPGAFCWNELATPDEKAAGAFYTGLFGWDSMVQEMGPTRYTTFSNHGRPAGGMYQPGGEQAGMPPNWLVYFAVADCDSSAGHAQELGAAVVAPPADIPGVGRFAILADPQGAVFGIIKLAAPPA
jgi:predicted enzyme related to lactoylglutathione lyase